MSAKVMSLRLPEGLAAEIAAVARAEGIPVSQAIREAIENHVAALSADQAFKERLKKRLAEDQRILKRRTE
ncbi:MAG TPA: ribbon-helix-helix protein, CopG family [Solirubrobacterales bacterium]|nr:ribbon-helix-helix protein, CopG family [Solirubrobacterales bacterium]